MGEYPEKFNYFQQINIDEIVKTLKESPQIRSKGKQIKSSGY
jgi:hypothetical protein